MIDTTSNEVGSNYDRSWVENAPLRRNSFFDLVAAAPGSLQGGESNNTSRTMVYGSSYDENSFQVDGVEITDNYFNEALAEPNVDAIEEVEMLSLGAPAEYGNLTGAVYNIVTRQGTNQFHGDAAFYLQSDGMTSDNSSDITNPDGSFMNACPDGDARCPWTRDKYTDWSAQLGGPLVKDKLWFFASYGNQRDYYWDVGVDSSNPLTAVRCRADRYFFKLNWQLNPKHKLRGTFHLRQRTDDAGLRLNSAPETAATRTQKTPTPGLGYTGILSDKTVVEVRYSGFYGDVTMGPTDPGQPRDLNRFYDVDTGFVSGGHYYWYDLQPKRTTITAKVSHLAENFLGETHDFRFGVQYSHARAPGLVGYNDYILHLQPDQSHLRLRNGLHALQLQRRHPRSRRVPGRYDARERPAVAQPGRALRLPEGLLRRAGPAGRERQSHGYDLPPNRLLHVEHDLAEDRVQPEADRGRPDRAQGPLWPLLPCGLYRGIRQQDRPEHHADIRRPLRPPVAAIPRPHAAHDRTRTSASTPTTRARTRTSSSRASNASWRAGSGPSSTT